MKDKKKDKPMHKMPDGKMMSGKKHSAMTNMNRKSGKRGC